MPLLPRVRFAAFLLVLLVLSAARPCAAVDDERDTGPWDLAELAKVPTATWGEKKGLTQQVFYTGEPFEGKPTRVFAYYARPEKANGKLPAIVLVHGGGGKAFSEWAEIWAKRGYAAIAMDLAGVGPDGKRLPDGGPGQSEPEKFDRIADGVKSAWTYSAVANVMRAVSLIRSLEDVDPERVGITGISWGGYLTCIVAGVDDRLKVAVPVYGCGYLHEDSAWLQEFAKMTPALKDLWVQECDPSQYLPGCRMPILFMNGTNDFAYPLGSYQKSYRAVHGPRTLCITVRMPHGHGPAGWGREEIGLFVDSVLRGGVKLPEIGTLATSGNKVSVKFSAPLPIKKAELHYTTDEGAWQKRTWQSLPATLGDNVAEATLPVEKGIVYFMTITDERGAVVSTEHVVQ